MPNNQPLNFDDQSLNNFFASSNQPMLITDSEGQLLFEMNNAAIKITGYDESLPQPVENILQSPKNRLVVSDPETAAVKKEFTLIGPTGRKGFIEADITPILYHAKEALLFTLTDITEKKLYRAMLEDAIEEEINLKTQNEELKKIAYLNLHLARKPLANILGLVNVIDLAGASDQTMVKAISFLRESGQELNEVIKTIDPQLH